MAKYKAIKRGYDGKQIIEPGQVFEFDGAPGAWMEPLDEAAKKAMAAYIGQKYEPAKSSAAEKLGKPAKAEK